MSRTLDLKLRRDLVHLRGQVAAIMLILAAGVASLVSMLTAYHGLSASRDAYYARYRMPDVFAPLKKAPLSVVDDIAHAPGVRRARGRIVFDLTLELAAAMRPVSGRILSLPDRREDVLSDVLLLRGGWFEGDGAGQVIVADSFARAHGLGVGDGLTALLNDRLETLTIVGTAIAPEYVLMVRGGAELLPDPDHFTVMWCSRSFTESVFDFEDACNDVIVTLDPDATEADVVDEIDRRLERYGGLGAYGRDDQISARVLSDDIAGLRGSATVVPAIFMGAAAFVLHMVLRRLLATQRTQIAVLRAFGFRTRELVLHYLKLSLLIGALGAALGTAIGIWLGHGLLDLYLRFYALPIARAPFEASAIFTAFALSLAVAGLGAAATVRDTARLRPAEGMRPESPPVFRHNLLERAGWLWTRLGFAGRMVVRSVMRARARSVGTVAGVAIATGLILTSFHFRHATDVVLDHQFRWIERQDLRITFHDTVSRGALRDVAALPGVRTVEAEMGVPVRLVNGWREKRTAILGLERGQTMHGVLDAARREIELPRSGLLLSRHLAETLAVRTGDALDVQVLSGRRRRLTLTVSGLVDDYFGVSCYADAAALSAWQGEEAIASGAVLRIDRDASSSLWRALGKLPSVASVASREQLVQSFVTNIEGTQGIMNFVMVVFAGTIAFGVLYNNARITLAEKRRELSSLRVLGFRSREVLAVLVGENLLLAALALAPGFGIGALLAYVVSELGSTDLMRFPFEMTPVSFAETTIAVAAFALIANLMVARRLARLDFVDALKGGE